MFIGIYFIDSVPYLLMIQGLFVQQILLMVVELYAFYRVICNYKAIHGLKKSLLEGKPLNHKENWRKVRIINGIFSVFFILIALTTILIPLVDYTKSEVYELPKSQVNLPIIRLADIEQNQDIIRIESRYNLDGISRLNRVTYNWSLLSPVQYEIHEKGVIESEMWNDNSGHYSPSIRTYFYQLTFPKMADGLIRNLMKRYVHDPNVIIEEVKTAEFDKLYVAKEETQKQIFTILDDKVIYINYYGNKNEDDIIHLLYRKLADKQEREVR